MARGVKAKTAEPARRARKPVPPAKAKAKVAAVKKPAAAARPSATPARALSKDALRAQVEKLERANTALRTKNREANRAAKLSAARMAELEGEVARLQTQLAAMSAKPSRPRCPIAARQPATSRRETPCRRAPPPQIPSPPTARQRLGAKISKRIFGASSCQCGIPVLAGYTSLGGVLRLSAAHPAVIVGFLLRARVGGNG